MSIVRRAQPWLGTLVSIEIVGEGDQALHATAFAAAFAAIARAHKAMSVQDRASDIARLNAAASGESIQCDPWTVDVMRIASRLHAATGGMFDVALGTAHGTAYRIADARSVVKLDGASRVDLGGIAKGYAVDRAVAALRACGVRRGLVNAGGDLRAFGSGVWPIIVRGGSGLALERGAIATSQYRDGRSPSRDDALIAPSARAVHRLDRTVTVAAPRCVLADALTKVVALSGDASHPLLHRAGGRAWLQ
ncbi:MAG TPA: FAD:protein FMN transferase [Burkholderiaceae bacterium]|nr:FAD:protein FMN transferase [Burkholderiaceae bacterium]